MKKIGIAVLLSLQVITAWAGQSSGTGKITKIHIPDSGDWVRIEFSNPIVNPDGCGAGEFYIRDLALPGGDRILTILLTAYTADRPVDFWINGCTDSNHWGSTRPQIRSINLLP